MANKQEDNPNFMVVNKNKDLLIGTVGEHLWFMHHNKAKNAEIVGIRIWNNGIEYEFHHGGIAGSNGKNAYSREVFRSKSDLIDSI
jgi:hypothetical protein